jgi:uncharacterized protein (DUF779 family)
VAVNVLSATDAALAELASLRERHGPLMLFQSGGCCDGSSPLCLHEGELLLGANDLLLGEIDGTSFYIDADQYARWNRPAFLLDLLPGASDTLSLEGLDNTHFVVRTPACSSAHLPAPGLPFSSAPKLPCGLSPMRVPRHAEHY